ncbi:MAG: CDP-2,3-bis-(O-geranylgeranyl)-sn-glycerol synthase [Candidatus Altiarchaeota archaeon]
MLNVLINVFWFTLPAYVANSIAIDVSGIPVIKNYSTPIDFGKSWRGKRILGDGKTWRGLILGGLAGGLTGMLQSMYGSPWLPQMTASLGIMLGFGALVGDSVASFIKRRMGFGRGHPLVLLDSLDYIFGSYMAVWILVPVNLQYLAVACIISPPMHIIANIVAYMLKLKKKPW